MKLKKSIIGMILIILYYAIFGAGVLFLIVLIMLKVGILAGLAAGFVLGIICGIFGGELEFREHRKMLRKRYDAKIQQAQGSSEEPNKIVAFRKLDL